MMEIAGTKARELLVAQQKAVDLFHQIGLRGLIRQGASESAVSAAIFQMANELYGVKQHWHKRIVRSGPNTLAPYAENPPDRIITGDDIVFLDLGPVFEDWEADFGRTFVLGDDPAKHKLRIDVEKAFARGKEYFQATPDIKASELFDHAVQLAHDAGWEFGGTIAGHLIGHFPHERIAEDKISLYVHPENHSPIRQLGSDGFPRHWILEIHFVDRQRQIGAFFEEPLTTG